MLAVCKRVLNHPDYVIGAITISLTKTRVNHKDALAEETDSRPLLLLKNSKTPKKKNLMTMFETLHLFSNYISEKFRYVDWQILAG